MKESTAKKKQGSRVLFGFFAILLELHPILLK